MHDKYIRIILLVEKNLGIGDDVSIQGKESRVVALQS